MKAPGKDQMTEGLRRAWYPVARSVDIESPQAAELLGVPLVAFRTEDGRAAVTARRCLHRGGDLAAGRVVGDSIECPYHGWRYRGDTGRCVAIPAMGPDARIPANAEIASYPAEERYGLVWTCVGDPLVGVPDLPELEPLEMTFLAGPPVTTTAGMLAALENFRDVAHFPFVHATSMGEVPHRVEKLEVEVDGFHCRMTRDYSAKAGFADIYRDEEMVFNYHAVVPSLVTARLDYGDRGQRLVAEAFCPLGVEGGCRIFMFAGTAADYTVSSLEEALSAELGVLAEDKPILDGLTPPEVPLHGEATEVSIGADRYTLSTRRAFLGFIEAALADRPLPAAS